MSELSFSTTEKIQQLETQQIYAYKMFVNYVNSDNPFVDDLLHDLKDGLVLAKFLRNLSCKNIPTIIRKPTKDIEKLQNLSEIIRVVKDEGVKTSAASDEIFNGNKKAILSLLYQLMYKFRLGNCSVRMVDFTKWVKGRIGVKDPEFDLKQSLADGIIFAQLLNYLQSGVIDISTLEGSNTEKVQKCIDVAYARLNIPKLIMADYVAQGTVDDYCLYVYLTFFIMKDTHFEDNEVMNEIAKNLRERKLQARTTLRARVANTIQRMLDCVKNVKIKYPNMDDENIPEEAKELIPMEESLQKLLNDFMNVKMDENNEEMLFDIVNDPNMLMLKDWEEKVGKQEELIKNLTTGLERGKRRKMFQSMKEVSSATDLTSPIVKELAEKKKQLDDKNRDIEVLKKMRMTSEEDKKKLEEEVKELTVKIEELHKKVEASEELQTEIETLKEKVKDKEALEKQLELITNESECFKSNCEQLKSEIERMKKEQEDVETTHKTQIEELNSQNEQQQKSIDEFNSLIQQQEKEKETIVSNLQEKEAMIKEFDLKIQTFETECEKMKTTNVELTTHNEKIQSDFNELTKKHTEEIQKSEQQINEKEKLIEELTTSNKSKEEQVEELKTKMKDSMGTQCEIVQELDKTIQDNKDLHNQIEVLRSQVDNLLQQTEEEKEKGKAQVEDSEKKIRDVLNTVSEKDKVISELQKQIETHQTDKNDIQKQLEQLKLENDAFKLQIFTLTQEKENERKMTEEAQERLKKEMDDKLRELEDLKGQSKSKEEDFSQLKIIIDGLSKSLGEKTAAVSELTNEKTRIEEEKIKTKIACSDLAKQHEADQLTIQKMTKTLEKLENDYIEDKKYYSTLEMGYKNKELFSLDKEDDRRVLFNSLALAIKIVMPKQIVLDNTMLYEECLAEKVPLKEWNLWLVRRLHGEK
ncbi:DNA double-strand break repair Rad50 ATPase, putative [Entamoeba invadens IP1]|uniref:DNA double-strand break repair Rad50 ATPase, putative n=1 Tax=Entamoeba invadens IP1 TaxID=370355 RepID=UPI0002C3E273|nr:DNA double-strand break repair Rad50 ATPase, putative [Entamoeba invadens IP1]ELP93471.1 DNA double-strand break repair Rad50 ATPase, putative [Entamoeba invadens IP1]|eukprot:XP_004260242.1 DNA double-strand break repair Rad50 ATPase, putative [Entamoeba invadens IP1]